MEDQDQRRIVHQQIALLEDAQGQTLQTRFEDWCREAQECLTQTDQHGEPLLEAGKAKSKFTIDVEVTRVSNDTLTFCLSHDVKVRHARVPSKTRTAHFVHGIGLAQRVVPSQFPLFRPEEGQPKPMSVQEAEQRDDI